YCEFVMRHIQCRNWPDHSAPINAAGTIQLHREISQCPRGHPIVIHCSAGVGRTCTLLGVELMLEHVRLLNSHSGTKVVKTMRRFRLGAVQKAIQFLFMHVVVLELFCQ
ncbi:Protein-tyrosine phosphatase, partial [Oesophagostomum dentatum]